MSIKSTIIISVLLHVAVAIIVGIGIYHSSSKWGGGNYEVNWVELSDVVVDSASPKATSGVQTSSKRHSSMDSRQPSSHVAGMTAPVINSHSASGKGNSPTPAAGQGDGVDQSALNHQGSVLRQIRQRILGAKQYPVMAKSQGVEGIVTLLFSIGSQGVLEDAKILRTSGSPLLDQAALETLKRAMPYPEYQKPIQLSLKYDLSE